jgi:hypothetical protein
MATATAACAFTPESTQAPAPAATVALQASPESTAAPPIEVGLPEEAILIRRPASGSRLVGGLHVEGEADSTFEQTLVVELVLLGEPETILARQPVIIQAELGQRGPFEADIAFEYVEEGEMPGEIRVYATSPRDGGLTHLASSHITFASSGPSDVREAEPHREQIFIDSPAAGERIAGGAVRVEGVAVAGFEQTLVAQIYDEGGSLVGQAAITVSAAEMGVPGPFAVDVMYTVDAEGAGRIVVLDPSPAFGQTVHLASVEVQLQP